MSSISSRYPCDEAVIDACLDDDESEAGRVADASAFNAYAATKAAVINLTKTAALEYIRKGIRVNAVCPGFTDTPMVQRVVDDDPEFAQRLVSGIPARRFGKAEEIAAAVLYLCSDEAAFITGATLVIDGGLTTGTGGLY